MTPDSSLAPPAANSSLGQRLRAARTAQDLSVEDVCARLKLSAEVISAMEADDHARLGAAVFARGRLGNYARLVGVPMVAVDAVFARLTRELPALVTARSTSRLERVAQRSARQGVYVVLTAVIFVVPLVWIANGNHLPDAPASLTALDVPPAASHATGRAPTPAVEHNEPPVVASMAPFPGYRSTAPEARAASGAAPESVIRTGASAPPAAASGSALHLHFSADSWVEVKGKDGRSLEHGMIAAGSDRSYATDTLAQVTIGNADAVQVLRDGHTVDLAPFRRANIVRFTLSSDGSPAPTGD
jgi:cytoskeleton protein RodZ